MAWADNLQPASFRGVGFQVQGTRTGYGRRSVVHEYPDRDLPFAEDLGRRARTFKVQGFVLGDDAIAQSNALIEACEAKGAGKLVHPTRGEINVVCKLCDVVDSFAEGRMFRFTLDFSEAGQNTEPSAKVDTSAKLLAEIDEARAELIESFELLIDVVALPDYLLNEVTRFIVDISTTIKSLRPRALLPDYAGSLDRLLAALGFENETLLAERTIASTIFETVETFADAIAPELAAQRLPAFAGLVATVTTSSRAQAPLVALTGAIQAASLLEIAATSAVSQWPSQTEANAHRDQVRDLFDAGLASAASRFDDIAYSALQHVGNAAVLDITARGASLAPMTPWQVARPVPALVAAWRLYSDPSRDGEIADQLGANHPLFLPTSGQVISQ